MNLLPRLALANSAQHEVTRVLSPCPPPSCLDERRQIVGQESDKPAIQFTKTFLAIDPRLDPFGTTTEAELIRFSTLQYRLTAELSSTLGCLGLILTAVGLVAWTVTRPTREIGIRMALGACRTEMLALVPRQIGVTVGMGMLLGVPVALAATKAASPLLFGISPWDPGMFSAATGLLISVLRLAGFIPARCSPDRTDERSTRGIVQFLTEGFVRRLHIPLQCGRYMSLFLKLQSHYLGATSVGKKKLWGSYGQITNPAGLRCRASFISGRSS